jgi:nitroimidazol reductase NimA-like FMN-containing flavoprotein (pyridoxamine 5'-phosphate oxidase superfamily)
MSEKNDAIQYIEQTKYLILTTNGLDGFPNIRTLLSYATEAFNIYFSTSIHSRKVKEIEKNAQATAFFQKEGQELSNYVNVTVYGEIIRLETDTQEYKAAIEKLSQQRPSFKEKVEKSGLEETILYKFQPVSVKILDFSKGRGPAGIRELEI